MTAAESVRRDIEPVLLDLFNRLFPSLATGAPAWRWSFGTVVARGAMRAMVVVDHDAYAEVVFLDGLLGMGTVPHRETTFDRWEVVPETGF